MIGGDQLWPTGRDNYCITGLRLRRAKNTAHLVMPISQVGANRFLLEIR